MKLNNAVWITTILILLWGTACRTSGTLSRNETTQATLWVQNAAEFKSIGLMTYNNATHQLDRARTSSEAAYLNQPSNSSTLPPAVILDVDETVLDNSPFQARMILEQSSFTPEAWAEWVKQADAKAIPGVIDFIQSAYSKNIAIFYVTNRDSSLEKATIENLKKIGLPASDNNVLTKFEQPDWTSDKETRRAHIARNYRIIMLIGDDLNDFIPAKKLTQKERHDNVMIHQDKWGKQWFILPNPIYGSWNEVLNTSGDSSLKNRLNPNYMKELETEI